MEGEEPFLGEGFYGCDHGGCVVEGSMLSDVLSELGEWPSGGGWSLDESSQDMATEEAARARETLGGARFRDGLRGGTGAD